MESFNYGLLHTATLQQFEINNIRGSVLPKDKKEMKGILQALKNKASKGN